MLKTLFSSNTRVKIIGHFVTHPKERFYLRQLERLLNESLTPLRRELHKLENLGLLVAKMEGNQKYYAVNEGFPIYPELKRIILKTHGLGNILHKNLKKTEKIKFAFIYGSTADNTEKSGSDIDLMVIGNVRIEELHSAIRKAEDSLGREINYSIFTEEEIKKRKKGEDDFIMAVLKSKKIMLIGDEDELLRITK